MEKSGGDPAAMVAVGDLHGDLRVVRAFRGPEVLRGAHEDLAVEGADRQVTVADGDKAREVGRCEPAQRGATGIVPSTGQC